MRKIFTTRRRIAIAAVATTFALAGGGAAFAFFTTTGSGTGSATVGSATTWGVSLSDPTGGPLLPGSGTETFTYTVTNNSPSSNQALKTLTTTIPSSAGDILVSGVAVPGCLATWFTATVATGPTPTFGTAMVPGDTATGTVTVTMSDPDVNQDACQGQTPDVQVDVT